MILCKNRDFAKDMTYSTIFQSFFLIGKKSGVCHDFLVNSSLLHKSIHLVAGWSYKLILITIE